MAVSSRGNHVLWLCFHRNGACYRSSRRYAHHCLIHVRYYTIHDPSPINFYDQEFDPCRVLLLNKSWISAPGKNGPLHCSCFTYLFKFLRELVLENYWCLSPSIAWLTCALIVAWNLKVHIRLIILFLVIICSGKGHAEGSIEGIPTSSEIDKFWLVAQALGDIAFSYPFSVILIEIQVCTLWSQIARILHYHSLGDKLTNYKG